MIPIYTGSPRAQTVDLGFRTCKQRGRFTIPLFETPYSPLGALGIGGSGFSSVADKFAYMEQTFNSTFPLMNNFSMKVFTPLNVFTYNTPTGGGGGNDHSCTFTGEHFIWNGPGYPNGFYESWGQLPAPLGVSRSYPLTAFGPLSQLFYGTGFGAFTQYTRGFRINQRSADAPGVATGIPAIDNRVVSRWACHLVDSLTPNGNCTNLVVFDPILSPAAKGGGATVGIYPATNFTSLGGSLTGTGYFTAQVVSLPDASNMFMFMGIPGFFAPNTYSIFDLNANIIYAIIFDNPSLFTPFNASGSTYTGTGTFRIMPCSTGWLLQLQNSGTTPSGLCTFAYVSPDFTSYWLIDFENYSQKDASYFLKNHVDSTCAVDQFGVFYALDSSGTGTMLTNYNLGVQFNPTPFGLPVTPFTMPCWNPCFPLPMGGIAH